MGKGFKITGPGSVVVITKPCRLRAQTYKQQGFNPGSTNKRARFESPGQGVPFKRRSIQSGVLFKPAQTEFTFTKRAGSSAWLERLTFNKSRKQ